MIVAIIALCAVALFISIIVIRAILFNPPRRKEAKGEPIEVDGMRAAETLSEMIKCKTVSSPDKSEEDEAEFEKFKMLLPKLFPKVFGAAEEIPVSKRAILLRWRGKSSDSPTVLMAHYDVVDADAESWDKPPFGGAIEGGVIFGRGAIDTKGSLSAILNAAEQLLKSGFMPQRDIYFAFGGDEEINGTGAPSIVKYFKDRKITPGIVLDEGGAVVSDVFPGVKKPCAVVGIAEKGMINVEYSVSGVGGHSSAPVPKNPIADLSSVCLKLNSSPFKFRLTEPTKKMLDTLGRHSTFLYKILFANLWCFAPVLNFITRKSGGQLNAIVRTTLVFTKMEGSRGINVIPANASMASNSRIIPGESCESTLRRIEKAVGDKSDVRVKMINGMDPSPISRTDCEAFERLSRAIEESFEGAIVSPYLMTACSDSRHYGEISDRVYRFSPLTLSKEENATVHGNNERLPISTVARAVEFYIRLMKLS